VELWRRFSRSLAYIYDIVKLPGKGDLRAPKLCFVPRRSMVGRYWVPRTTAFWRVGEGLGGLWYLVRFGAWRGVTWCGGVWWWDRDGDVV
jgi:hypothetical protein